MSFSEICDKFELVSTHMKKAEKVVQAVNRLVKFYKKITDYGVIQFEKAIKVFRNDFPRDEGLDTMSTAVSAMVDFCYKMLKSQSEFSAVISAELIRPLDSFVSQFLANAGNSFSKGQALVKDVVRAKEKNGKAREKYFQSSELLEKYERLEKTASEDRDRLEKLEKAQKTLAGQKLTAAKNYESYLSAYNELEDFYKKYDSEMPTVINNLQNLNERSIHFTKLTLDKFMKSLLQYLTESKDSVKEFSILISNINASIDIRVFVDATKAKLTLPREDFAKYEKSNEAKSPVKLTEEKGKDESYIMIDTQSKTGQEPEAELVEKVLNHLIPNNFNTQTDLDSNSYSKISELLHTPEGRGLFCDILETKKKICLLSYSKATQLSGLIKCCLTSMMTQKDNDSAVFCKIVFLAHFFHTEDESGKRCYLTRFLENHIIWQDKKRWLEAIEKETNEKILESEQKSPKKRKSIFNLLKNIGKNFIKIETEQKESKLAAFTVISQFCFHMIHLGLTEDISTEIVLAFCNKFDLDEDRKTYLLAELQANQKMTTQLVPQKVSLQTRIKEQKRWDKMMPIGLAVDFLFPFECFELLAVSKQWKEQLKVPVFKKWLFDWKLPESRKNQLRTSIWAEVLKAHSWAIDYFALLGKVVSDPSLIRNLSDIIDIDVARSYQKNEAMPPQVLRNILKTYALYNEELGYCQGMNYVVGTIYLQVQDENLAFKILISLIDKFQMKNLFVSSLPKLRLFFYTLDRIIGLILPELHEKFKEFSVCAGHFSSPWFMTLYSSVLRNRPDILYPIWDMFILEGWKTIFKVAVVILSRLSRYIVAGNFENIMLYLSNLSATGDLFDSDFIQRVQKVNISNALLRDLESEYEHAKLKASSYGKNIYL